MISLVGQHGAVTGQSPGAAWPRGVRSGANPDSNALFATEVEPKDAGFGGLGLACERI